MRWQYLVVQLVISGLLTNDATRPRFQEDAFAESLGQLQGSKKEECPQHCKWYGLNQHWCFPTSNVVQRGEGGYGNVSDAFESKNGQCVKVAAKVIELKKAGQADKVHEEFEIQHRLQHPSILQVYEMSTKSSNELIIWMELATGGELFEKVLQAKPDESEGSRLMKNVAEGLNYIHGQKIAHMDINLQNILLTGENSAKIIDFGLAHDYSKNTKLSGFRGCQSYAAPEVWQDGYYSGYKADVWSLGVSIFAFHARFFPFNQAATSDPRYQVAENAQELKRSTIDALFDFYEKESPFSSKLKDLLDHMLILKPEYRFTMEQVLESPWIQDTTQALLEMGRVTLPDVPPDAPKLQRQSAKML